MWLFRYNDIREPLEELLNSGTQYFPADQMHDVTKWCMGRDPLTIEGRPVILVY